MTSYERHLDPSQPTDDIGPSVYISLAAVFAIVCGVALYAYPRDSQMIVTAGNAIDRVDAISPDSGNPGR